MRSRKKRKLNTSEDDRAVKPSEDENSLLQDPAVKSSDDKRSTSTSDTSLTTRMIPENEVKAIKDDFDTMQKTMEAFGVSMYYLHHSNHYTIYKFNDKYYVSPNTLCEITCNIQTVQELDTGTQFILKIYAEAKLEDMTKQGYTSEKAGVLIDKIHASDNRYYLLEKYRDGICITESQKADQKAESQKAYQKAESQKAYQKGSKLPKLKRALRENKSNVEFSDVGSVELDGNTFQVSHNSFSMRTNSDTGVTRDVKLARESSTNKSTLYVLKQHRNVDSISFELFENEAHISTMAGLAHAVKADTEKKEFLLLENYIPGNNLRDLLADKNISLTQKIDIAILAIEALAELHKKRILHRDIRLENMIYTEEPKKITYVDYELSLEADENLKAQTKDCNHTLGLRPPEMDTTMIDFGNNVFGYSYSDKSDIFLLGHALSDWLGIKLQTSPDGSNLAKNSLFPTIPQDAFGKILKKMVVVDPDKRASLVEVSSDFKMVVADPDKRASLVEVSSDFKDLLQPPSISPNNSPKLN